MIFGDRERVPFVSQQERALWDKIKAARQSEWFVPPPPPPPPHDPNIAQPVHLPQPAAQGVANKAANQAMPSSDPVERLRESTAWPPPKWAQADEVIKQCVTVPSAAARWASTVELFVKVYGHYLSFDGEGAAAAGGAEGFRSALAQAMLSRPASVTPRPLGISFEAACLQEPTRKQCRAGSSARHVELNLDAAVAAIKASGEALAQFQERDAIAAVFAMEVAQALGDDLARRAAIASGVTIRSALDACAEWAAAEAERSDSTKLAESWQSLAGRHSATAIEDAVSRSAKVSAYSTADKFGPVLQLNPNLPGEERAEIYTIAAKQMYVHNASIAQEQSRLQSDQLNARAVQASVRLSAAANKAASLLQEALLETSRLREHANGLQAKILLGCTNGAALSYAQQAEAASQSCAAAINHALSLLYSAAHGLWTYFGYREPLPASVMRFIGTSAYVIGALPTAAAEEAAPAPAQMLSDARRWTLDAARWLTLTYRRSKQWCVVIGLRGQLQDPQWAKLRSGEAVSLRLGRELLGAAYPRLKGVAVEWSATQEPPGPLSARLKPPPEARYPDGAQGERTLSQADIAEVVIAHCRRWSVEHPTAPALHAAESLNNASPIGQWEVQLKHAHVVEQVYLSLWLCEH